MKHFISRFSAFFSLLVILIISASAMAQQSLGDAARQASKDKSPGPTTKVYTNDDLKAGAPPAQTPSDASQTSATETNAAATDKAATADGKEAKDKEAKDEDKDKDKAKKSDSPEDQAKLDKEWADKIQGQKDSIALIERELDVLQRENKLRAADYYADAGTRLRDEKKYADDDRKYRDQIDAKQKELDDAKTKLDEMRDEARKAGASPGAIG